MARGWMDILKRPEMKRLLGFETLLEVVSNHVGLQRFASWDAERFRTIAERTPLEDEPLGDAEGTVDAAERHEPRRSRTVS